MKRYGLLLVVILLVTLSFAVIAFTTPAALPMAPLSTTRSCDVVRTSGPSSAEVSNYLFRVNIQLDAFDKKLTEVVKEVTKLEQELKATITEERGSLSPAGL